MKAQEDPSKNLVQAVCPKRPWVMMMFSDDEAVDRESVPPGLRFHLSRCPSCSALADELSAVSKGLGDLAGEHTAGNLFDSAQARMRGLLKDGPVLTGRVDIADEPVMAEQPVGRFQVGPLGMVGSALAACLVLALSGVWMFTGPAKRVVTNDTMVRHGWRDTHGEFGQYVWQVPVLNSEVEGPPIPAEANFTGGLAEGAQDGQMMYYIDSPSTPRDPGRPGASHTSSLERSLDKPQRAVSTNGTAKDR